MPTDGMRTRVRGDSIVATGIDANVIIHDLVDLKFVY